MAATIDTERYCWAFETWTSFPRPHKRRGEEAVVRQVCARLRVHFPGIHPIETLCGAFWWMTGLAPSGPPDIEQVVAEGFDAVAVEKSCLLARLIYCGEPLRTRRCPLHQGRWSGIGLDPCPHGCNHGMQYTGWIAG
jgi:hypothetical protein